MYNSPISIYETAMQTIIEQRENAIFAKVQDAFDVQVDKEELIRALKYDRNQYEVGYRDGRTAAMSDIVHCEECDYTCPGSNGLVCTMWGAGTDPDGWCYKAERKDNERL